MSSLIDLTPAQRRSILRLIEVHLPRTDVWAYGSRVKWTSQPASDLDLVAFADPEQRRQVADLREAFEESDLPFRVDLLVWDEIPEAFQEEIDAEHAALVEWTPGGQSWCTLGDLAHITMGQSPPGETVNGKVGVPLLNGPTEFGPHHPAPRRYTVDPRSLARCGDLLFCVRGSTTGRMNWADREYAIGPGIAAIRHKTRKSLQPFVRAVIESRLPTLLSGATGSVSQNVSATDLTGLPIPDLPLKRQTEIANVLATLDNKIELNRRMCDTLEAMVRAIYTDWFVDFGPVRAKVEGRDPGLPPNVATLFPNRLVDSRTNLGEIPEQWSVGAFGDVACCKRNGISPDDVEADTLYIGLQDMPRRSLALTNWGRMGSVLSGKFAFRQDDILFGTLRPHSHKVGIAPMNGLCSTDIAVLRPHTTVLFPFAVATASSSAFVAYNAQASTGTTMPRTNWKTMSAYPCVMPPGYIMEAFYQLAAPSLRNVVSAVKESVALGIVRNTLLPKLLSGQMGTSVASAQRRAT